MANFALTSLPAAVESNKMYLLLTESIADLPVNLVGTSGLGISILVLCSGVAGVLS